MNKVEHLLTCLSEECSEVTQAVCKAQRFGMVDGYPGTDRTNISDIRKEVLDLMAVIELLNEEGIEIPYSLEHMDAIDIDHIAEKKAKVRKYMHYAHAVGALDGI